MIKIKNDLGEYVTFSGVRRTKHESYIEIRVSNGVRTLKCSFDHRFVVDGKEITADSLKIGDKISSGGAIVEDIKIIREPIFLYDPVNVGNTFKYKHDREIISHNCRFLGSSTTLVDPDKLFEIRATDPVAVRRNGNFRAYVTPIAGHSYVMTVDVAQGRGQDYSTFTIFDTSVMPYEQVATFRDNMISPLMFPDVIVRFAKEYNEALVIIENNDAGKVVCNGVYYEYEYENTFIQSAVKAGGIGVTMSKMVKRVGCSNLKDLVELGKLTLRDAESITELSAFEVKENSYAGKDGVHDDMVMNLVMFAWFVSTDGFGYTSLGNLRDILYADRLKEMEDDIVPLGILGNNTASNYINPEVQRAIETAKEWNL